MPNVAVRRLLSTRPTLHNQPLAFFIEEGFMRKHLHQAERLVHYRGAAGNLHTLTAYTQARMDYITNLLNKKNIIWWLRRVYRSG